MIPGEVRVREAPVLINSDRERRTIVMINDGDRPIQIGSHLHLPDANPALSFDRDTAQGFRLDTPAGTSVRFEPGVSRSVGIVSLGGHKHIAGLQIHGAEPAPHHRDPKEVVPFGTPGTEKAPPSRPLPASAKVTETAPEDEQDDPANPRRGER